MVRGFGADNVGGLVDWTQGSVTESYAVGPVSGSTDVGGLVGLENVRVSSSVALNQYVNETSNVNRVVGKATGNTNTGLFGWNGVSVGKSPFTNPTSYNNYGGTPPFPSSGTVL